jgi:hypothetical protein
MAEHRIFCASDDDDGAGGWSACSVTILKRARPA